MKRILFFFGVLAIVAVGHAGAKNVPATLSTQAGSYNEDESCEFQTIQANCNPNIVTVQCTLADSSPAYTNSAEGKCTRPLYLD